VLVGAGLVFRVGLAPLPHTTHRPSGLRRVTHTTKHHEWTCLVATKRDRNQMVSSEQVGCDHSVGWVVWAEPWAPLAAPVPMGLYCCRAAPALQVGEPFGRASTGGGGDGAPWAACLVGGELAAVEALA